MAAYIRDIKYTALLYTEAEKKVIKETSNDPWGPSTKGMKDIAFLTKDEKSRRDILKIIWSRLSTQGPNWRHVYKSLVLLEYLIRNGPEEVEADCSKEIVLLRTAKHFSYETQGRDYGKIVRDKASDVVKLLIIRKNLKALIESNEETDGNTIQIVKFTYDVKFSDDIMNITWRYIEKIENLQHIYNTLSLLHYLLTKGSDSVFTYLSDRIPALSELSKYRHGSMGLQIFNSSSRIQEKHIRTKAQELLQLVGDHYLLQAERSKCFLIKKDFIYQNTDKAIETDDLSQFSPGFLAILSLASHDKEACKNILSIFWENLKKPEENWIRIYAILLFLEYLVITIESEAVREECEANVSVIQSLVRHPAISYRGEDQFQRIRRKAELLHDVVKSQKMERENKSTLLVRKNSAAKETPAISELQKIVIDLMSKETNEDFEDLLEDVVASAVEDDIVDLLTYCWEQIDNPKNSVEHLCNILSLLQYYIEKDSEIFDYVEEIISRIEALQNYFRFKAGVDTGRLVRIKANKIIDILKAVEIQRLGNISPSGQISTYNEGRFNFEEETPRKEGEEPWKLGMSLAGAQNKTQPAKIGPFDDLGKPLTQKAILRPIPNDFSGKCMDLKKVSDLNPASSSRNSFQNPGIINVLCEIESDLTSIAFTPTNTGSSSASVEHDPLLCVVCMVSQKKFLLLDCLHLCLCEDCVERYHPVRSYQVNQDDSDDEEAVYSRCPLCRQPITKDPIKVHL